MDFGASNLCSDLLLLLGENRASQITTFVINMTH